MTNDTDLLEQIVRGVMRQLASRSEKLHENDLEKAQPGDSRNVKNELLLTGNVITGEMLSERLGRAACLSIGPRSVLTPSARDWLREHDIAWQRQAENKTANNTNNGNWKVIIEHSAPAVTAALDGGIAATHDRWRIERADDFRAAVDSAVSTLCRAETDGVVLFTNRPAAAACLANRNRQIRAAVAMGKACVRAARRQMGANLLCVNPTGQTVWELKTILREVEQGGRPSLPEGWQE